MKACLSYFRMQLVNGLQYRTAALAGIFTQFFWGFMEIQLYRALYADHAAAFPMALNALVCYIWLRQAFLALFNTWSFENELFESIRDGGVAYELCRPASLYGMWVARNAALRAFIQKLNATRGITVLLTTHDMQDIEALAHRVLLIGRGRLLMDGGFEDVRAALPQSDSLDEQAAALYRRYGI